MKRLLLLLPVIALLALPTAASASYTISKAEAQWHARDAARTLYGPSYGVTFNGTSSSCRPQGMRYDPSYNYHRWVCGWAGRDDDGEMAFGLLRITGHSGGYGYLALRGIHWG